MSLLFATRRPFVSTALIFGAATSDKITITAGSTVNDLNPCTFMAWIYPTTLTAAKGIFEKGSSINVFRLNDTTANIRYDRTRATTNDSYITSSLAIKNNIWSLVCFTYDSTASPTGHIYIGNIHKDAAEPSYSTSTSGTGGVTNESGNGFVGNRNSGTAAFQGSIGHVAYVARVLNLTEVISWQWNPRVIPATRLFYQLGNDQLGTQRDQSGLANHGALSGPTLGVGPDLFTPYACFPTLRDFGFTEAATGGPFPFYTRRNLEGGMISMVGDMQQ